MRASEDSADDEFVFVGHSNKGCGGSRMTSEAHVLSSSPTPPLPTSPTSRHHQTRLNQPIPTSLEVEVDSHSFKWSPSSYSSPSTTIARSKATPLPPELIELLPPHLRENTVPDFSTSSSSSPPPLPPSALEENSVSPARPPLPSSYHSGDYSNLDSPSTPTTPSTPPTYDYLSDLITPDIFTPSQQQGGHGRGGRSASVSSSRPSLRGSTSKCDTASHTAPAALALTDSGISSGGSSSSSSSSSSRSNSSKSLPREGSRTSLSGRPLHPPSPKFTRTAPTSSCSSAAPAQHSAPVPVPASAPGPTQVSYSAVLASDGQTASMFRRLEAHTSSPLVTNFRAASSHSYSNSDSRSHASNTSAMGQAKSVPQSVVAGTSSPNHTPNQTPPPTRKSRAANRASSREKDSSARGVENIGGPISCAQSVSPRTVHSPPTFKPLTTMHSPPTSPLPTTVPGGLSSPTLVSQAVGGLSQAWVRSTPPSSPELRRAWNTVGIPVSQPGGMVAPAPRTLVPASTTALTAASPRPHPAAPHSDPDNIYDNLVVRHPPLASPASRAAPMASVPPTITPHPEPTTHYHPHIPPSTPPPVRRVVHSPVLGKPPSPPTQRRANRSGTPTGGWSGGNSSRPASPLCLQWYPPSGQEVQQCGGCWVPVWGSSPQLVPGGGTHVYPVYVYSGPPGAVMCEGRSHSCDRLPPAARSSPPPSPRTGRRSASPWRGGSVSPLGHRLSPAPECTSGRPPRPRRPPLRKAKTVEVGCLDHLRLPSSTTPNLTHPDCTPAPLHPLAYLPGTPATSRSSSDRQILQPLDNQKVSSSHKYVYLKQQQTLNYNNIPEQCENKIKNNYDKALAGQCEKWQCSSPPPYLTSSTLAPSSPMIMSLSDSSSPSSSLVPGCAKQGQSEVVKPKVTYKTFYKCMKSLLKPVQ